MKIHLITIDPTGNPNKFTLTNQDHGNVSVVYDTAMSALDSAMSLNAQRVSISVEHEPEDGVVQTMYERTYRQLTEFGYMVGRQYSKPFTLSVDVSDVYAPTQHAVLTLTINLNPSAE